MDIKEVNLQDLARKVKEVRHAGSAEGVDGAITYSGA